MRSCQGSIRRTRLHGMLLRDKSFLVQLPHCSHQFINLPEKRLREDGKWGITRRACSVHKPVSGAVKRGGRPRVTCCGPALHGMAWRFHTLTKIAGRRAAVFCSALLTGRHSRCDTTARTGNRWSCSSRGPFEFSHRKETISICSVLPSKNIWAVLFISSFSSTVRASYA